MYQNQFLSLAKWTKFVGWVTFITGIISGIVGLFGFVIGALPGVISAFMGWKLIKGSQNAEQLASNMSDEQALHSMLSNYLTFFKTQGILLIISFAFVIIGMIAMGSVFGMLIHSAYLMH